MAWFVKTETFRVPAPEVRPHLEAHRRWVADLRSRGVRISSGYLVDGEGRPGGGGGGGVGGGAHPTPPG
ncbi:MAG: hypothetical protein ACK5JJ_10395, partial [Cyanobacteriota bacterium]